MRIFKYGLRRAASLLVPLACLVLCLGCGGPADSGPPRFRVTGTVTFDGKPIPAGTVYFTPDEGRGNRGPAGSAAIRNGRYDTDSGKGVVGGPHYISVDGFDGAATGDQPFGRPLFVPYSIEVDLPQSDSQQDVDVPASAAEGLDTSSEPV